MRVIALVGVLGLAACASHHAAPALSNGRYFLMGDEHCIRAYHQSPTRIACLDKKGNQTGYRDAMTDQDMAMYMRMQAMAQVQYDQSAAALVETNRQLSQTTQRIIESNAQQAGRMQPETYNWQQPKNPYVAPNPEWTERTYAPTHRPGVLREKRWENGALWCIYSNDQVRQAEGAICPNLF
jgi:hypothetical protein